MITHTNGIYIDHSDNIPPDEALQYEQIGRQQWVENGGKPGALGSILLELMPDGAVQVTARAHITRIRRITGYLSAVNNFNDAKRAELADRQCHWLNDRRE